MTPETQVWILTALVGFFMTAGWWSVRKWIQSIDMKFDKLIEAVQKQSEANIRQSGDINSLSTRVFTSEQRLNDHSKRINKLEIKAGL